MSGDKTSKTDKASEIWYKLLLNEDFKNDLEKIKKDRGEPVYYFKQYSLFEKHGVSPTQRLLNICDQYLFGKINIEKLGDHLPARLQTPSEEELKKARKAFIKLWIYDGVSRDEILDYIKKNWRKIKTLHQLQDAPKVKRLRKIENKKLIEHVLKLNKLSTKELRRLTREYRSKGVYREVLIKRLLEAEGYSASIESIKGITTRYKHKGAPNQA